MRAEGRKELPDEASPRERTFDSFTMTRISSLVSHEGTSFAVPRHHQSPSGIGLGGGPQGIRRSRWRMLVPGGPIGEAVQTGDTCQATIGRAQKYL
jgi:hypothetical protein